MRERIEQHYVENYEKFYKMASYRRDFTPEDAEDVVHDAYEKAFRYPHSYANSKSKDLDAWMTTILHNCWKDHYNKYVKGRSDSEEDSEELEDHTLEKPKKSEDLAHYLNTIPKLKARVFKLRRTLDYSEKLTSRVLGVNLHFIRNTLRDIKKDMIELHGGDDV